MTPTNCCHKRKDFSSSDGFEKQRLNWPKIELMQDIKEISQEISQSDKKSNTDVEVYDRTKKILAKPPYIAPIQDQKMLRLQPSNGKWRIHPFSLSKNSPNATNAVA